MSDSNLQVLMFIYFGVACLAATASVLTGRHRILGAISAVLALLGIALIFQVSAADYPGRNFLADLAARLFVLSRTDVTAIMLGASAALPLASLLLDSSKTPLASRRSGLLALFAVAGTLVAGSGFIAKELISPYLPNPGSQTGSAGLGRLAADGFVITDYADTEIIPIRLAVAPDGRLFVSGHYGIAAQDGVVAELVRKESGSTEERIVARMLNRPYGLIAMEDELLVSRSGQHTRWTDGRAEQISTGAVTRLRDLNNDGVMDWYDDVVVDMPGAKGPDFLHQNNAIALGQDGALYVTTANHSDAYPPTQDWEGVILRASGDDFDTVDVFASGLRNPFGLAFDGTGRLFATDNDSQGGKLGGNLGDKLIEVKKGAFYGHPYALDDELGVTAPLMRSGFALGGLAYAPSGSLPSPWDESLYVVVYGEGKVVRLDLTEGANGEPEIEMVSLATVPGAVDLAISSGGDIYVAVYPDKVVRIAHESNGL